MPLGPSQEGQVSAIMHSTVHSVLLPKDSFRHMALTESHLHREDEFVTMQTLLGLVLLTKSSNKSGESLSVCGLSLTHRMPDRESSGIPIPVPSRSPGLRKAERITTGSSNGTQQVP